MPTPSSQRTPTLVRNEPSQVEEQIRRRAFELYEARGREDGRDSEDWLRAEAEITGKSSKAAA